MKLASVATDILGASGRLILEAIVSGQQDAEKLAGMSKGKLRDKIPQLQLARFLLRQLLDDLKHTESKIATVEAEIDRRSLPFEAEVARLCSIPGSGE